MRITFLLLTALSLTACSSETAEQGNASTGLHSASLVDSVTVSVQQNPTATERIVGERIDGPANVRDGINGKLLFSLDDQVLVSSTPLENDWYRIGLLMDIDTSELGINTVKKGRKIIVDGEEVGEIKADMRVWTGTNYQKAWVELSGYTHKDNIKPGSIIENVLPDYLQTADGERSLPQLQTFIRQFEMENAEQFEGYTIYYNYENWLEDPSPMWRIGLVFQKDKLVSILHSRPLEIPGTTDHKLERGFDCLVYDDVANGHEIVKLFNDFVTAVD